MKTIGILGGGQLGLLLAQSLTRLGATVIIYEAQPDSPACKTACKSFHSAWNDMDALEVFVASCDVITYEFENVDSDAIARFAAGKSIIPSPSVLKTTQNRAREKSFLRDAGLPHVRYAVANQLEALPNACSTVGFPLIVKSAAGGYDGKLQLAIASQKELNDLLADYDKTPLANALFFPATVEQKINLALEVSCITARSPDGEEVCFPIFENVHTNHILDTTICPATISAELAQAVSNIAMEAARKLVAFGLLCTEFFIAKKEDGDHSGTACGDYVIYINEFAPRPHNSGHVTISACTISQFDALARILLAVPITTPKVVAPGYFCMGNILGDVWAAQGQPPEADLDLSALAEDEQTIAVILYGKSSARPGRKMGHFVTYAAQANDALAAAKKFRQALMQKRMAVR